MRSILTQVSQWLEVLPASLEILERTAEKIKDPMFRYFEREVTIGANLLKLVRLTECPLLSNSTFSSITTLMKSSRSAMET